MFETEGGKKHDGVETDHNIEIECLFQKSKPTIPAVFLFFVTKKNMGVCPPKQQTWVDDENKKPQSRRGKQVRPQKNNSARNIVKNVITAE